MSAESAKNTYTFETPKNAPGKADAAKLLNRKTGGRRRHLPIYIGIACVVLAIGVFALIHIFQNKQDSELMMVETEQPSKIDGAEEMNTEAMSLIENESNTLVDLEAESEFVPLTPGDNQFVPSELAGNFEMTNQNMPTASNSGESEALDNRYLTQQQFLDFRNKSPDVTRAEFDLFLMNVKQNSTAIDALRSETKNTAIAKKLDQIDARLQSVELMLKNNSELITKHEKNQGWFANRLSKLESNETPVSSKRVVATSPKRVKNSEIEIADSLISEDWKVRGISYDRAYLINHNLNQTMKVLKGTDVPGFGKVVRFDAKNAVVYTTHGKIL